MTRFSTVFVFAFALVACGPTMTQRGFGTEVSTHPGLAGPVTEFNGEEVFNRCMAFASQDPSMSPAMKFQFCRSQMPGVGAGGMYAPGVQMMTPGTSGYYNAPGSAAFVSGPSMPAIAPNNGATSTSASSGSGDYATKDEVKSIGVTVMKHDKDICKLNKSINCGK